MVTAVNDGFRDTREVGGGGNVGRQYRHVRRGLNGLNRLCQSIRSIGPTSR